MLLNHPRIARWLTITWAAVIAVVTLTPTSWTPDTGHFCLLCGPTGLVDATLNVLLFVPLGAGLAFLGARAAPAIAAMCAYSSFIEVSQLLIVQGRHASVSDLLANSVGGAIGLLAGRHVHSVLNPNPRTASRLTKSWLCLWFAIQVIIAFSLVPVMPEPPYYLQVARPLGPGRVVFPGRVLGAMVGTEPLRGSELVNATRLRALLSEPTSAPITVTVVPDSFHQRTAEIVRLSRADTRDILRLEQHGEWLVFGMRTGADVLRLQPYTFRLRGVFQQSLRDTLTLRAHYARDAVMLAAVRGRVRHETRFTLRLSNGWRLLTPQPTAVDGGIFEGLASVAFLAIMVFPAAFWNRHAGRVMDPKRWPVQSGTLILVAVVAVGMSLVPMTFGLRPAALWEWTAIGFGIGLGTLLGSAKAAR